MNRATRSRIFAAATIAIIAYLAVMGSICSQKSAERSCRGIIIDVIDTAQQNFVTAEELRRELGRLPSLAQNMPLQAINTDSLQRMLRVIDKIENATVSRRTDGFIHIHVEPMRPVARVFDGEISYYINKDGKRISAEARYFVDVPVIQGHFNDTSFSPLQLLPLISYVEANPRWSKVVSMYKADSPRDIILIPAMRDLVFNIGDLSALDNKFSRLDRMIGEVLPLKGWTYYDTISVKWSGQIVATRANKRLAPTDSVIEEVDEDVEVSTMLAGTNIAPGQALAGRKANSERPVPGTNKPLPIASSVNKKLPEVKNDNDKKDKADSTSQKKADINSKVSDKFSPKMDTKTNKSDGRKADANQKNKTKTI